MHRKNIDKKLIFKGSWISVVLFAVIVIAYFVNSDYNRKTAAEKDNLDLSEYDFTVSFIDVGQGDCELISCKGKNILVDGGEAQNSEKVLTYLKENNIEVIDYYILTHPHSDHIGASADIIDSVNCLNVVMTDFSDFNMPTTRIFENLIDSIESSDCNVVLVEAGDSFKVGDMEIDIIAPIEESDDYNEMSIVFTASYSETTALFTGDTTVSVETEILKEGYDVSSDVIKIAHHGSTTSNSEEFIDAVSPEFAVISCGKDNEYGHPHREIVAMLNSKGIDFMQTDKSGTVVYYGDGVTMELGEYEQ